MLKLSSKVADLRKLIRQRDYVRGETNKTG